MNDYLAKNIQPGTGLLISDPVYLNYVTNNPGFIWTNVTISQIINNSKLQGAILLLAAVPQFLFPNWWNQWIANIYWVFMKYEAFLKK